MEGDYTKREHDKDIQRIVDVISEHTRDDKEFQDKSKSDTNEIKVDIKTIKENHLSHIEKAIERMSTDLDWLKKFFWLVAASSIGGLITGLVNLLK